MAQQPGFSLRLQSVPEAVNPIFYGAHSRTAAALIVLREVFLHSYPTLWHGSTLLVSEAVIALGSTHVPSGDNAHET